jgi:hypothetical protein
VADHAQRFRFEHVDDPAGAIQGARGMLGDGLPDLLGRRR